MQLADTASERAVLSGIFQHGEDAYLDIADFIQVDTFTDTTNQAIYKSLVHLFEVQGIKQVDLASVISAAKTIGQDWFLDQPTEAQHLRSIANGMVRLDNVRVWAGQIRKLQVTRLLKYQLEVACASLDDIKGHEPIEQILGVAENAVFDFTTLLYTDETQEPTLIYDGINDWLDEIEANPREIVGISSGMPYYDQAIGGGFRRKTVSLIGARPKVGKSMLAANIGMHVAKQIGIPVLYLDTEMAKEDHWSRMLPNICFSHEANVTINELESGKYAENHFLRGKVREAAESLDGVPFHYVNISGKPFEETISMMRRWVSKHVGFDEEGRRNDCLILYDYIKMMSGNSLNESLKEYQVLGFMMTSLHNFSVRHDVPTLSFIQLNRDGIDRESTDIIAGSDRVLWLVTNFTVYKEKSSEEIADTGHEQGNRKLVPISARHGEGLELNDYINVRFEGRYGRIEEGETKNNLKRKAEQGELLDGSVESVPFDDPETEG